MIKLNFVNQFLILYILETFVSDYLTDGAALNERNHACSLREWGCDDGGCISFEKRCDGGMDCSDGSDEAAKFCSAYNFGLTDPGSWSDLLNRSKRQSTRCSRNSKFQCRDGQCIDVDKMCDGQVDCADESDEILATCRSVSCPTFLFRCSYGACVNGDAKCDGTTQCADNSDEENEVCRQAPSTSFACKGSEWTCTDGGCIDSLRFCDGSRDCADGSDETIKQCSEVQCPSFLFRCSYGACVDSGSDCNGKVECADGSDESPELCHKGDTLPRASKQMCVLPRYPHHGTYTMTRGLKPGDSIPFTILTYSCDRGYNLRGVPMFSCDSGTWSGKAPTCENQCKPLKSTSVNFTCYKQDSILQMSCDQRQDSNSRAKATCKDSYYSVPPPKDLNCIDGSWDYMPICTPECGTVVPKGSPLVISGTAAEIGEFPWHVGLYRKISAEKRLECGGSIFSPNLVVTAAHCVYNDQAGLYPASVFAVAAGKLYRRWNTPKEDETYVQKIGVRKIEIPENYKGIKTSYAADIAVLVLERNFMFSSLVRPVCIRFDNRNNLNGQLGKVAGWGLTAEDGKPSNILQTATLPIVSYQECYAKSTESFKPLITLDKICAGYTTGIALCHGDSGGGLVLARSNGDLNLYFLYGIVSTSPRNEALTSCSAFAYTGFTDLSKHQEWFQNIWSLHNNLN